MRFTWTHPANEAGRARAVLRLARFQAWGRLLHRRTLVRLGDRSRVWADPHRYGALKVVCGNPPDHSEMLAWRRVLRPGDLFVDVGANVGSYAIWAGDLGAEVIALEPADDTFALLVENVVLNGYPTEAIQAAAGAAAGTVRFTRGRDDKNIMDPGGSAEIKLAPFPLTPENWRGYDGGARGQNERFRMRFTNGAVANAWFALKYCSLFTRPLFTGRSSSNGA